MQVGPRPKSRWERRSPTWSVSSRRPGSAAPAGALWATQESVFRCGCRLNSTWWRSSPDLPEAVARRANVSRSWLYLQPDIRAEVERLRDLGRRAPETAVPARQRSTDSSLLRRLSSRQRAQPRTRQGQPAPAPPTRACPRPTTSRPRARRSRAEPKPGWTSSWRTWRIALAGYSRTPSRLSGTGLPRSGRIGNSTRRPIGSGCAGSWTERSPSCTHYWLSTSGGALTTITSTTGHSTDNGRPRTGGRRRAGETRVRDMVEVAA